jgi:hypothetical protein
MADIVASYFASDGWDVKAVLSKTVDEVVTTTDQVFHFAGAESEPISLQAAVDALEVIYWAALEPQIIVEAENGETS